MKKYIVFLLCAVMILSMAACGADDGDSTSGTAQKPPAGTVGALKDQNDTTEGTDKETDEGTSTPQVSAEVLELLGITAEQFAALMPEEQQMLLDEIGAVIENNDKKPQPDQTPVVTYTPDDVMAGGSYVVVLGDYMNSITLYYENGVLVKLVESFQKSFDEDAYTATYEGQALEEYGFNFIDWSGATLQEILDGMRDYGGFGQYTIKKAD